MSPPTTSNALMMLPGIAFNIDCDQSLPNMIIAKTGTPYKSNAIQNDGR